MYDRVDSIRALELNSRVESFHSYSYANASIQLLYNYSLPCHIRASSKSRSL